MFDNAPDSSSLLNSILTTAQTLLAWHMDLLSKDMDVREDTQEEQSSKGALEKYSSCQLS